MNGTYRMARKDHICDLCALPIRRGTRYFNERVTPWDHPDNEYYFTFRAHLRCEARWQEVADWCDGYAPDPYDWWTDDLGAACPNGCTQGRHARPALHANAERECVECGVCGEVALVPEDLEVPA